MLDLRLEDVAQRDLEAVYLRGLKTRSPAQALAFARDIRHRCSIFQSQPRLGFLLAGARKPTRLFTFDQLVSVAYRVTETEVVIVRIFPRGRDVTAWLKRRRP